MRPLVRTSRVRLSHVETTDAAGLPVRISWEHINGWPRICRPSSVAELLHPGLPRYLYIHPGCSSHTIERLRERVIRRKFDAGTYDRFWRVTPPATPREFFFRVGGASLLAMLVALILVHKITAAQVAQMDTAGAVEFSEQFSHLTLAMIAVTVGVTPCLCLVISFGRTCREPALAIRTTARGFDRYLASGAVRFTTWLDAACKSENMKGTSRFSLRICPDHGVRSGLPDWIAFQTFLNRKFVTQKRHPKLAAQVREGTIALMAGGSIIIVIFSLIFVARSYFPPEPTRAQHPETAAEAATAFLIIFAFPGLLGSWAALDFVGLHRFRLRIQQALRRPQ